MKCRRYCLKNGLILSSSKTQCVFIGDRQLLSSIPPNTTTFNGDIMYPSNHVKNFGVHIDRYMLFDVHINELNKKKEMGIFMYISRINDKLDKQNRIIIIDTCDKFNRLLYKNMGDYE